MKFIITDASQYASGKKGLSPEYIDKLKDKYKLETIKTKTVFNNIEELTIITINNIYSLVKLQNLIGEFITPVIAQVIFNDAVTVVKNSTATQ